MLGWEGDKVEKTDTKTCNVQKHRDRRDLRWEYGEITELSHEAVKLWLKVLPVW